MFLKTCLFTTKKDISTVQKKKYQKYVGLFKNPFLKAHVNVHSKKCSTQQCVASSFNAQWQFFA
ncbi:hypothetical protein AB205_0143920 [Aquarana catesbeiana]|uniref:Uncharacterized protein n=1 Tax=Aquarana catesbeiana TaxID=8400 RepID=A0A2G9SDT2_AQUCT|nr:hypothetical protein AB205_0143920 [Aquarana catesbeiana]